MTLFVNLAWYVLIMAGGCVTVWALGYIAEKGIRSWRKAQVVIAAAQAPEPPPSAPAPAAGFPPAAELFGQLVMRTWSYDTGISVLHNKLTDEWNIDLPPVEDQDIAELLRGEDA